MDLHGKPVAAESKGFLQRSRSRRKSISSTRESMMALGLPESWNPPMTPGTFTPEERRHRTSMFFGLYSPKSNPPPKIPAPFSGATGNHESPLAPPKPSFSFPLRSSSRAGSFSSIPPGGEGRAPSVAIGNAGELIGVALGSPSQANDPSSGFHPIDKRFNPLSPELVLPVEPFQFSPPSGLRPRTAGGSLTEREKPDEPWKAGGWKRMFGKAIFGRRGSKGREATPELPVPMPVPKPATRPKTPCLDVDIPSVEMERYSIMFGNLLHKPSEKSSLFARRQSKDSMNVGSFGLEGSTVYYPVTSKLICVI